MSASSYSVLLAFTFLFLIFTLQFIRVRNSGSEFLGSPTLDKFNFYSAKTAIFITWALFIIKAISPKFGYFSFPAGISWIAVAMLYPGVIIVSVSMINLGKSLKVGLPSGETTLQTHGLYRYSRNPLYVGVHLITLASCIYFPDLLNISFAIYGIYLHHLIIRQEEHFLKRRFGNSWMVYCSKVRRYI